MSFGTITARVYTSQAKIPVENAIFGVTKKLEKGNDLLGVRFTDENGRTTPVTVDTTNVGDGKTPNGKQPYVFCDVKVAHPQYETITVENVQIFPGVETVQDAELIPLPEDPLLIEESENFNLSAQNL